MKEETKEKKVELNIYEKLQLCRVSLQNKNLKKSGKNKFAGFEYFELRDFLPTINELLCENGLFSNFSIKDGQATLTITDGKSSIEFTSPTASADVKGCTPIQSLGAVHTYMKRYLYLNALEIVESDMLDSQVGKMVVKEDEEEELDLLVQFNNLVRETDTDIEKIKETYSVTSTAKMTGEQLKSAIDVMNKKKNKKGDE